MKKCKRCGTTENLSVDHIYPKYLGGSNSQQNKMILCRPCHNWKEMESRRLIKSSGEILEIHPMFEFPIKKQ